MRKTDNGSFAESNTRPEVVSMQESSGGQLAMQKVFGIIVTTECGLGQSYTSLATLPSHFREKTEQTYCFHMLLVNPSHERQDIILIWIYIPLNLKLNFGIYSLLMMNHHNWIRDDVQLHVLRAKLCHWFSQHYRYLPLEKIKANPILHAIGWWKRLLPIHVTSISSLSNMHSDPILMAFGCTEWSTFYLGPHERSISDLDRCWW